MPYVDPKKENEKKARWRERNAERQRSYQRDWHRRNRDRVKAQAEEKRLAEGRPKKAPKSPKSREEVREWARAHRARIRRLAVKKMGNCCERCGFADPRALEFDHRVPVMQSKRRRGGSDGVCREILELKHPKKKYALLCANCHRIKTKVNGEFCRQDVEPEPDDSPAQLPLGSFGD